MSLLARKYRIYPNKQQSQLINKTIGCARYAYNTLLENYKLQLNLYNKNNKTTDKPKILEITALKPDAPFLSEVDSLALANSKQNLSRAFTNFFDSRNGKRKSKKVGFPSKHKKSKCKLSYTTNNQNGTIRIVDGLIKLPKIGFVRLVEHIPFTGTIRSVTVTQERNNTYYVSVLADVVDEKQQVKQYNGVDKLRVVGIDMSYSSFAIDSDNNSDDTKPKYVKQYRVNERRRRRLNRRISKCEKGSNNRAKARIRLANMDRYIANCRMDYCHKMSKYYASKYDVIVLEDIDLSTIGKGLRGANKSVSDMGFGMFRDMLSYKCKRYDSLLLYADKWYASSKTCNYCGSVNKGLRLSDREWVCPECGAIIERDYNAACNLRDYAYKVIREIRNTD